MPRGDGTGPAGMGPMTGRAAGYCAGYSVPGYMNPVAGGGYFGRGRGFGFYGRGGGRGWRNGYYATGLPGYARAGMGLPAFGGGAYPYAGVPYGDPYGTPYAPAINPQQEAGMLKEQAKAIQEELKAINERIGELETAAKKAKEK